MSILNKIKRIVGSNRVRKNEFEELENFVESFDQDEEVESWLQQHWANAFSADESYKKSLNEEPYYINKSRFSDRFTQLKIAASAILLVGLGTGLWFLVAGETMTSPYVADSKLMKKMGKEVLSSVVLEQGDKIYDLSENDISLNKQDLKIVGNKSNLRVLAKDDEKNNKIEQHWSTIKVPKGKDYYVVLSDSTQIWMNACSELSFPNYFVDGKREVKLTGEAYFEVRSDVENPFYIKTHHSVVQVTGTKFNVYSYKHEYESAVTLVEGKVGVNVNGHLHKIKPGEQFVQNEEGYKIKSVNPYHFISWKEGVFEFHDMSLKDMSLRLTKWFEVEFVFENEQVSAQRFTGMIRKDHDIEYFIKVLEKTTNLSFQYQESQIIISQK